MGGLAVALRFVPYSDDRGNFDLGWSLVMGGLLVLGVAASVYVVYTLEILKLKRFRMAQARRRTSEFEVEAGSSVTWRPGSSARFECRRGI